MEPKQPIRRVGPEFSPPQPSSPETWQGGQPERFDGDTHEHQSQPAKSPGEGELPAPILPVTQVLQATTPVSDDGVATPNSSTLLTAADDDVIEKEWVDKAKKIIGDTKGDPYRREYEVGQLQADYLEKRYGKKLGEVE